jgi:hypothetical protein
LILEACASEISPQQAEDAAEFYFSGDKKKKISMTHSWIIIEFAHALLKNMNCCNYYMNNLYNATINSTTILL